jgi:SAM-dependent methyltransferase
MRRREFIEVRTNETPPVGLSNGCAVCPFCSGQAGSAEQAKEFASVPAVVREYQTEHFTVWRCRCCDSLHCLEPVNLSRFYKVYPFAKHQLDLVTRTALGNRARQLLRQGVQKTDAILDFGCGNGLFVTFLRKMGFSDVTGYDLYSNEYSDTAVLNNEYEVVLAQDVIEHADDPAQMLQAMVNCLKPQGLICLGTPMAERIDIKKWRSFNMSIHQPYHRHIFSARALVALARRFGLKEVKIFDRHFSETKVPLVNLFFMHKYVEYSGNVINVGFERPRLKGFLLYPQLIFYAFFGFFLSRRCEMMAYFRFTGNPESNG